MRSSLVAAGALALTLALAGPASAAAPPPTLTCENGDTFPCGIQLETGDLQKVPAVFKFQARVSQAKLPIGQGLFSEVIVKLLAGDQPRCEERFQNVEVRDSVLNLEIGRNMSCELDEEMATQTGLAFQVCLGSSSSCLKPIELSSVPYAVKASYAYMAQSAQTADQAAVADYAYRIAADPDLQVLDAMSSGYFDFRTRSDNDGYLQWTPLQNSASPALTITGQAYATQGPLQLERLVFDALTTKTNGALMVAGAATIAGDLVGSANFDLVGNATIMGTGTVEQSLTVGDARETGDTATLVVKRGGADVQGGGVTIGGGGIAVTGASSVAGTVDVSGTGTFRSDVAVAGDLRASGGVLFPSSQGGPQVFAGAALVAVDGGGELLVLGPRSWVGFDDLPAIHVDAPLVVNSDLTTDSAHVATFNGGTRFNAPASFNANVSFNGGEVDFRNATALPGLREFLGLSPSGDATLGNWSFAGDFINHAGASLIQGKADSNELDVLSDLRIDGTTIMAGGLSVLGGDQGRQAFFDVATSFKRGASFEGPLRMAFTNGGASGTSDLFVPFANGTIHVDDSRKLTELVFEAPTRFERPSRFDSDATFNGWIQNGAWRLRDGAGFQHTVGSSTTNFGVFLGFPSGANQIVLDQNRSFPGGTRVAGLLTVDQAMTAGSTLTVAGAVNANGGLAVKVNGASRLTTDASQTRILQRAQVDGALDVRGGGNSTMLGVSNSGVSISRAGVVTQVAGPLQVNSGIKSAGGLSGSGMVKTTQGDCGWYDQVCPAGLWMAGSQNNYYYSYGGGKVLCCTIMLAP
ncbi:MAG: hypothetical protein CVU56_17875 [Deltaproteobacteria bacterium HGW-Deltaproteobacteria-14]|jgi:hypothetical protein|nr:MAG: hypothetical protein CVU56_17875 [Deltaproteobacteria bacterium HGW-Deltaproteobacteria-14]